MTALTIQQAFNLALHHQAGRLAQAERLYRQILTGQPNHADALHLLGIIAHQSGRHDVAVGLIRHAIAVKPDWPEALSNLGEVLRALGQLDEAIAACRQALAFAPDYPEARYNLGNALKATGQLDEAIASYRQATALRPGFVAALGNLGVALKDKGQLDDAIAAFRRAIALDPSFALAHGNFGRALCEKGRLDEALASCRQAIALDPIWSEAYCNLGNLLRNKGRLDEAIAVHRQVVAVKPDFPEAHVDLGNSLRARGQLDESIASYRRAIALKPAYSQAYSNLGVALRDQGRLDEAMTACRQAIALKPELAEAHNNLALALLAGGDFSHGWDEYEWRWKCKDAVSPRRNFPQPLWDGRPLAGARLLLYAEQGFGDTLQFIRYLPLAAQRGGSIVLECQAELQRLIQAAHGDCTVVARGQPLPAFDVHCPLLSLPRVFGTSLETIPRQVPYLHADAEKIEKWRERLEGGSIKVGLAWAGSKTHLNDRNRSIALAAFAPLTRLPGISFHSLQKGEPAEQIRSSPEGLKLIDWSGELTDFTDTAALIANLDLVISVDTAVVHLAGALGKPAWVLLPFVPDWRWLLEREDSPWYPTMRLFRQPAIGDWQSVMGQVTDALAVLSGAYPAIVASIFGSTSTTTP